MYNCIPNVFVDTSYAVYFYGYSAWKDFKREFNPDIIPGHPFELGADLEFLAIFENKFWNGINRISRQYTGFVDKSRIYFAFDCPKKYIWRNQYFDNYKIARKTTDKSESETSFKLLFRHVKNIFIPNLMEKYDVKMLECPTAEGDDIIAVLCNYWPDKQNVIIGSDKDLLQLNDKAVMYNLMGAEQKIDEDITAKEFILIKSIMGDKSDDIPQVFNRVGYKTAKKLVKDKETLKKKLLENKKAGQILKRNLHIMDFKNIPKEIVDIIESKIKEVKHDDIMEL